MMNTCYQLYTVLIDITDIIVIKCLLWVQQTIFQLLKILPHLMPHIIYFFQPVVPLQYLIDTGNYIRDWNILGVLFIVFTDSS